MDDDYSNEIKRFLLLQRKAMTNLDNILKNRDITLLTMLSIVKEWIRKLWYIYTMEYYSALKRIHLNQF